MLEREVVPAQCRSTARVKEDNPFTRKLTFARQIDQPCCPFGGIYRVKKNTLKGCKHFNGFNAAFGWQK